MARKTPTYRPVSITIWDDLRFTSLSDDGKLLWLFFLTSSECPIPGILLAGEATVADRLGWPVGRVRSTFADLVAKGINVAWEGRVIWCANGFKHQPVAGPNAMKPMATAYRNIPDVSFKHALWSALRDACTGWSREFAKLFAEPPRVVRFDASPVDQVSLPLQETRRSYPQTPLPNPVTQPRTPTPSLQEQEQEQDLEQEVFDLSSSEPSTHGGGDLVQAPAVRPPGQLIEFEAYRRAEEAARHAALYSEPRPVSSAPHEDDVRAARARAERDAVQRELDELRKNGFRFPIPDNGGGAA